MYAIVHMLFPTGFLFILSGCGGTFMRYTKYEHGRRCATPQLTHQSTYFSHERKITYGSR